MIPRLSSCRSTVLRATTIIVALIVAFAGKRYYSVAEVESLKWILWPTARLSELLIDNSFAFERGAGYFDAGRQYVIAKGCAGVNFLIISFVLCVVARLRTVHRTISAVRTHIFAAGTAYALAVTTNAFRVSFAIFLYDHPFYAKWISPSDMHLLMGTGLYFGLLLGMYAILARKSSAGTDRKRRFQFVLPLIVYFAFLVGIPALRSLLGATGRIRGSHILITTAVPTAMILLLTTIRYFWYRRRERGSKGWRRHRLAHSASE